jgi:Bacterial extracellular solute-binding proteins, family 5 Middle
MNHRGGEEKPDEGTETSNASRRTRSGQRSCEPVARPLALLAAIAIALLAVSGAGGAGAQTPKRGGTVVVAYSGEPACLNPLLRACFFLPGERVLPGAFDVGPDLTYRPNLVSTVDMVSTSPQTLVYHIRPQARWSDGQPLTARDFLFTFRAFTNPKLSLTAGAGDFGEMRRVEVVNSKTLKVVLRNRDPEYRRLFPVVLPRHALVGADLSAIWQDSFDDPRTGKPIGSGPFLVAGFDRGRQLSLVRNPRYWGSHTAYLDRLIYRFFSPVELIEEFQHGQADVVSGSPSILGAISAMRKEHPPGIRFLGSGYFLGALRDQHGTPWSPRVATEARPAGARVRHRSRRYCQEGSGRPLRGAACRQSAAPKCRLPLNESVLPAKLGCLSLPARLRPSASRKGWMSARNGSHLRLLRGAPFTAFRHDCGGGTPRTRTDARPVSAP